MVVSILPWRMFILIAATTPSLASLFAEGVMLAVAMWKVRM